MIIYNVTSWAMSMRKNIFAEYVILFEMKKYIIKESIKIVINCYQIVEYKLIVHK